MALLEKKLDRVGQQYNTGEKPTVVRSTVYIYFTSRHAGSESSVTFTAVNSISIGKNARLYMDG